jgi:transposase
MENVMFHRVARIDAHTASFVVSIVLAQPGGTTKQQTKTFVTFRRGTVELAQWLKTLEIELVVMETTGMRWRAPP